MSKVIVDASIFDAHAESVQSAINWINKKYLAISENDTFKLEVAVLNRVLFALTSKNLQTLLLNPNQDKIQYTSEHTLAAQVLKHILIESYSEKVSMETPSLDSYRDAILVHCFDVIANAGKLSNV